MTTELAEIVSRQSGGKTWPDHLPPGWSLVPFKRAARIRDGQVDPTLPKMADLPLFAPNHVESGTGRLLFIETANEQGAISGKYPVRMGEVVYSKIRPALRKVMIAPCDGLCSADMYALRPTGEFDARFLFYCLLSDGFSVSAELASDRVAMPKINRETLADLILPHTSLEIQQRVAALLDRKTAAIDALIEKKQKLVELLAEKRAALINQAVTKGLDPTVPMKDSGIPWIGEIPAHWEVRRLKFVCRLETGHTPSRTDLENWIPDECTIPWVSLNDTKHLKVSDEISETCFNISSTGMARSSAHLIEAGAVVFTRDASIGLTAITTKPMAVSQHIIAWVCGSEIVNRYLLRVIDAMADELDRLTFGATLKTIGMGDVKSMVSPIPPVDEQLAIVAKLGGALGRLKNACNTVESQISRLQEYRQALITAAVTGQLEIPESTRG